MAAHVSFVDALPKKLMVYASEFSELAADASAFGWTFGEGPFEWAALKQNLDREWLGWKISTPICCKHLELICSQRMQC